MKNQGKAVLAVLATLAMVAGLASVTTASGSGGPTATAAKKKCKKAKKGTASAAKKKCKKKKKKQAPVVRATLTWTLDDTADADMDLYAFDTGGKRAGNGSDAIPLTTISTDIATAPGSETFTDNNPAAKRAFSFGVCYTVGGTVHAPFTLTYVTADGQTHTETRDPGSTTHYEFPGGPQIPVGYCPS